MSILLKSFGDRLSIAKRGRDKDLDILVNDEDPAVRKTIARHVRCKLT